MMKINRSFVAGGMLVRLPGFLIFVFEDVVKDGIVNSEPYTEKEKATKKST